MGSIKRIKIYSNNDKNTLEITERLRKELINNGFTIVDNNPDLCISVGGDGSFLNMVKASNFNDQLLYIGVNSGTLGFLQEININETSDFISRLKDNNYKVENINIQETIIKTDDKEYHFNSLNEIVLRHKDFKKVRLPIYIDNEYLETLTGDGVLISTSTGSTAYNMSNGGAIVYNTLDTLSITPIAPINNKAYNTLRNSFIIPVDKKIKINTLDHYNDLLILIDGEKRNLNSIKTIETYVSNRTIKCLRMNDFHFIKAINDKILNNISE